MSNSIVPQNSGNKPLTFRFGDVDIRIIKDEGHEPLFIASDICKALDLANVSMALAGLPDDEKDIREVDVIRGTNKITVVTESGMYRLVFRSNKPQAEKFRLWVFHEVLPAIRETGTYAIQKVEPSTPLQLARQMLEAMESHQKAIDDLREDVDEIKSQLQTEVEYFTVIGYCRKMGLSTPSQNEAQSIGIRATKLSKEKGYSIGNTSDARYGTVHTYHVSIRKGVRGR